MLLIHSMPAETQPAPCQTTSGRVHPSLRRHVLSYGGFRSGTGLAIRHRLLPFSAAVLIVDPDIGPLVTGARVRMAEDGPTTWGCGVTVGLTPGGVPALLGVPMRELAGWTVPLSDLIGPRAAELAERLAAAPGWAARFGVLDEFLGARTGPDDRGPNQHSPNMGDPNMGGPNPSGPNPSGPNPSGPNPSGHRGREPDGRGPDRVTVEAWLRLSFRPRRVGAVAAELGVGRRRLERSFQEQFGMSPGTVGRIARFQRAVDLLSRGTPLAAAATRSGYADQPHLSRETRELAGVTPGELRAFLQDPPVAAT